MSGGRLLSIAHGHDVTVPCRGTKNDWTSLSRFQLHFQVASFNMKNVLAGEQPESDPLAQTVEGTHHVEEERLHHEHEQER
jgi:hypothetical protein